MRPFFFWAGGRQHFGTNHTCRARPSQARRRIEQGFLGAAGFLLPDGKLKKVARKRVGFVGMKAPAREGAEIFVGDKQVIEPHTNTHIHKFFIHFSLYCPNPPPSLLFHINMDTFNVSFRLSWLLVRQVGVITSGTFSPCLKKPIAMGYISAEFGDEGKEVSIKVRNKMQPATVSKMPFVETSYFRVK